MMEWALPTRTRERYNALLKEFSWRNEVLSFLRGARGGDFSANIRNRI